mmetsp:Transcript_25042/g.54593  ORF Transcript_25042/g.54593 Transcript_25042/m.54593 type:complete len:640 (+) Transcript_25042:321-2240(+)
MSTSSKDAEKQPPMKRSRNDVVTACTATENGDDSQQKKMPSSDPSAGAISPSVLSSAETLQKAYRTAMPYRHGLISNLCADGFLEKVLDEVKNNSKVTFKESDLFRFYQSIDLANLDAGTELAKRMPFLIRLRTALYSSEFRSFVEKAADLQPGTLTDQVDCAANCHTRGCHLLCHDDVIGTRKVSYIIYLTDPDCSWTDDDGGRLELYESLELKKDDGNTTLVPAPFPVKTILPAFNSLAYFVVTPGVSFHSVQEVFCDRPRLSIQGWYHAREPPDQIENATLNRLKSTGAGEDTEGSFIPFQKTGENTEVEKAVVEGCEPLVLSAEDETFLAKYIDATYLTEKSIKEIGKCFEEQSSVQLRHFLNEEWERKMKKASKDEDEALGLGKDNISLNYNAGVSNDWKAVGPAHKQRFLEYDGKEYTGQDGSAGGLMLHVKRAVLESPAFGRWLKLVSSLGMPLGYRGRVRRFRPGLDYTVAHYGILTQKPVLDATLCFAAGSGKQLTYDEVGDAVDGDEADAVWDSGDAGGFECYIAADEEGGEGTVKSTAAAADEYNEDDDTELLSVSASNNTLSLVYRDPGTMRFVKYVGSSAPSSRWDISLEYEVDDTHVDATDDEDELDNRDSKNASTSKDDADVGF